APRPEWVELIRQWHQFHEAAGTGADGRDRMMWVVVERARAASRWGREGKRSLRVKVVSRDSCALQRPCALGAPVAAVVEFAGARAAAAAAAHDEDAD